jgi:uncharacterized OB-fold protein
VTAADGTGTGAGAGAVTAPVRTRMEPPMGAESAPFWEATREGILLVQWCTSCDRGIFYPRAFCPYCPTSGSNDRSALEWRTASGRATVHAATIEYKPAATGSTFSDGQPYVVALVDLDEGVRMMTNIVGCRPEDVHPGLAVTVTWEPLSDGRQLPLFTPAPGPGAAPGSAAAGSESGTGPS